MKIRAAVLVWALAAVAGAQTTIRPGGGGGSSIITSGTTATSGCTDLSVLSSNGSLVVCPGWAKQATSGAWTIGSSSLGTSVVPLTVTPGTGSTANLLNLTNSAGSLLARFKSTGDLELPSATGYITNAGGANSYLRLSDSAGTYLGYGGVNVAIGGSAITLNGPVSTASLNSTGLQTVQGGVTTTWGSSGTTGNTYIANAYNGVVQLGTDANGAAVNQTFKAHDGITGTDISGANLTIAAGRGTGAGSGGSLYFQTAPLGSTGTTAQTLTTVLTLPKSGGIQVATGTKPACASGIRGTIYYVAGGAGVLDTLEVCRKDAADAYAWVTLF